MLLSSQINYQEIEEHLVELAEMRHLANPDDAFLSRLSLLLPEAKVTTNQWAAEKRYLKGANELPVKWTADLTPYIPEIQEACDTPGVNVVAVQGNARSGKTVAAENHALKRMSHGPWGDIFWYMQDDDAVQTYMEERGEWNLENHEEVAERIDRAYKRNARDRKRIGASFALWMGASDKTTRGKAAPFIVADEIDAYMKKIRKAILVRLRNRQREFGNSALLFLASHPDLGPEDGIASEVRKGLMHLWWALCPYRKCRQPSSPALEASIRLDWNVSQLLRDLDGASMNETLAVVQEQARLICPHCRGEIDDGMRKEMMQKTGIWLQPHQRITGPQRRSGAREIQQTMGFVIQCWMTPFVEIGEVAREWVAEKIIATNTGDDTGLRESTTKTKGEVYTGADESVKVDDWITVRNRLKSAAPAYVMRTVPLGVDFLTAFVDIQVNRFEVRVIGWSAHTLESWLIDAYPITTWPADPETGRAAFEAIRPFTNAADWDVLDNAVVRQSYPLARAPDLHLPIAKVAVDLGGAEDATPNARAWGSRIISRKEDPIPEWRVMLVRGAASKTGETYGVAKQVQKGEQLTPVWERTANNHRIKRIIAKRMKISVPGPGMMHLPADVSDAYIRELVSESLVNDEWIASGRNETWDAWVACETARWTLQADRYSEQQWRTSPPAWGRPFRPGVEAGIDSKPRPLVNLYSRLVALNTGNQEGRR